MKLIETSHALHTCERVSRATMTDNSAVSVGKTCSLYKHLHIRYIHSPVVHLQCKKHSHPEISLQLTPSNDNLTIISISASYHLKFKIHPSHSPLAEGPCASLDCACGPGHPNRLLTCL